MRTLILALILLGPAAPLAVCQEAEAEPADEPVKKETVDELLKRVEEAHTEHKDFKGSFDQTKFLALFGDEIRSNGTFIFKKPDHVRWEYAKPHKSILVVTGETGKKWSESTGRVENFKLGDDRGLDAVVKQLFTWFKGEFTKLKDDYRVEIKSREPVTLTMTPKKDVVKKFIASIEVTFTKGEDEIKSVKIIEPADNGDEADYTLYQFKDTKLDSNVKDDEFKINK